MKRSIILIQNILYIGILIYSLTSCYASHKIQKNSDSTALKSKLSTPINLSLIKKDSLSNSYGIESDIIYSNMVYPPEGSQEDENLGLDNPNVRVESLAIKNSALSCFNTERYKELVKQRAIVTLIMYTDKMGIIKEVLIRTSPKETLLLREEECIAIIHKIKGLKCTIPPAFVNFSYYKVYQTIHFR